MTPLDYARRYWKLQVPMGTDSNARTQSVRIHQYRLVNMTGGASPALPAKDRLLGEAKRALLKDKTLEVQVVLSNDSSRRQSFIFTQWSDIAVILLRPFIGKGSPEEVQVALQLAVRYGLTSEANLQQYADDSRIGLDCNGFVGNYLRQLNDGSLKWYGMSSDTTSSSSRIRDLLQKSGRQVKKLDELTPDGIYLMGMVDASGEVVNTSVPAGHVVVSEPFTLGSSYLPGLAAAAAAVPTVVGPARAGLGVASYVLNHVARAVPGSAPTLQVVESTGAKNHGLVSSTYAMQPPTAKGVFTVQRGLGMGQLKVKVFRMT